MRRRNVTVSRVRLNDTFSISANLIEMKTENNICRLCLNTCDIFEAIGETTKEILNRLQLEIDLSITEDPIMCEKCSVSIQKWFQFKSSLKTLDHADTNISGNNGICCLCVEMVTPTGYFVSLTTEEKSVTSVKVILLKYFSEIDINQLIDPVICETCFKNLEACSNFAAICLQGEEKIKTYCEDNRISSMEQVDLHYVLENKNFTFTNEIKTEKLFPAATVSDYDNINMDIKFEDISQLGLEEKNIDIKTEDSSELGSEDKNDTSEESPEKSPIPTKCSYKCELCDYRTEKRSRLNHHMIVHKSMSEVMTYNCEICTFRSKHKFSLHNHMVLHQNIEEVKMHKCEHCEYQTRHKTSLRTHTIIHKNSSEITMHKCTECNFETKYKYNLRAHMVIHKKGTEVQMHKCTECDFETKHRLSLRQHMLVHKSSSEVTMHKCTQCSFESKRKYSLRLHVMSHKISSESTMHKCTECSFKTECRENLCKHMATHEGCSTYKCHLCDYQTINRSNLRQHFQGKHESSLRQNVQKSNARANMHKCTECSYETKDKTNLRRHTKIHKSSSEVTMHECTECSFVTKYKSSLRTHILLIHESSSKGIVYKCTECSFEAKYKSNLETHMVIHKNVDKTITSK